MFFYTFATFFALWALMVVLAWRDSFATVDQMRWKGIWKGVPLTGHHACLTLDAIPFPTLMGAWVASHGADWSASAIVGAGLVGSLASIILHYSYVRAGRDAPEFTTYRGRLTPAGWVHVVYMSAGFAIILLGYTVSVVPSPALVYASSGYLLLHVVVGVHVINKVRALKWFPYKGASDPGTTWPITGATVALAALTLWALR